MRIPLLPAVSAALLGAGLLATPSFSAEADAAGVRTESAVPTDISDQQRRKRAKVRRAAPQQQIACTRFGCRRIPPGCQIVGERTWDGAPSGFDAVVCPYR